MKAITEVKEKRSLAVRLGWFVLLWLFGVGAVGGAAFLLRALLA